ncbi:SCO family protein [Nocardioides sp.]|uniref:SCO family protein n=1 Tax=Nocardioides sp. TaxID=35761 RepID=UPI0026112360|nr:SCO family protein [Nocardioides sp.]
MRDPRARAVRSGRSGLGAVVATLLLALTACGGEADVPFSGRPLDSPYVVPDVDLVDTDGDAFSLAADTDKRLTMVFFGYTRCEDVCPAVLSHLASALTRLDDDDRSQVDVVMVTSDPDHDTPQVIRDYLDTFDRSFIGATSDFDTIVDVGRSLAVGIDRDDPGGHTTQILGVDTADEAPIYWGQDTTPAQFASDIHTLLEDS